ncbi:hypothetical protein LB503_009069 [Fusarium chuoi]|nr:hypothetical protein LB503_009069 [Fusarium chuoi]
MYTREFDAVNSDRQMRQITRLLTYPVTIGSILHELSPYSIKAGERMTTEGLKSFSGRGTGVGELKPEAPAVRIFILGARAESSLPRPAWVQLAHMFPEARLHLIFVGPESMANRDDEFPLPERTPSNPFRAVVEDRVCHEWEETLPLLLETKIPIISTGYTQFDMERDVEWVNKKSKGEFDILLQPGENVFRSLRWDLNDMDPQDVSCGNWGVWAFRGKRYETATRDA